MFLRNAALVLFGVVVAGGTANADEGDAPTGKLIGTGLALALPVYAVGVITHEGSHAVSALLVGGEVKQFAVLPGRYGRNNTFYFGYTRVSGLRGVRQRTFFWLSPKIVDLVLLGGFAAFSLSDNLPENRYAAATLTVFATGFWVDFSKDIFSFRTGNDVVKTYNANGAKTEWQRLPYRLLHLALAAGAGYAVFEGYRHVFEDRPTDVMAFVPLLSGRL